MKIEDKSFLIIAGQPKSGTTSLYDWLSKHPDISSSKLKEERFFLDKSYPLKKRKHFNGNNIDEYLSLFKNKNKEVLLEACPDYLYNSTPLRISHLLPNAKIIIIVRDPISRMVSAYNFFIQRGMIDPKMSFDDYIIYQKNLKIEDKTPIQYRSLSQCSLKYILPKWEEKFEDKLLVIKFDELKLYPYQTIKKICNITNISSNFYSNFDFSIKNKTKHPTNIFLSKYYYLISDNLRIKFANNKFIMSIGRVISNFIKQRISNDDIVKNIIIKETTKKIIYEYHNR